MNHLSLARPQTEQLGVELMTNSVARIGSGCVDVRSNRPRCSKHCDLNTVPLPLCRTRKGPKVVSQQKAADASFTITIFAYKRPLLQWMFWRICKPFISVHQRLPIRRKHYDWRTLMFPLTPAIWYTLILHQLTSSSFLGGGFKNI